MIREFHLFINGCISDIKVFLERIIIKSYFDKNYYNTEYVDVKESGINPITHFVKYGWMENRNPNDWFSTKYYLNANSDVRKSGQNPFIHYILNGRKEGRLPFEKQMDVISDINNCDEYLREKELELIVLADRVNKSGLFDSEYYINMNHDVFINGIDPFQHFCEFGCKEKRNPSSGFNIEQYLRRYPIVNALGVNPLLHYLDTIEKKNNAKIYCSVIIPTYNRFELLPNLLERWKAVLKKSVFLFEIILCDDGSDDGAIILLESEKELPIKILKLEHCGPGSARNAGVLAAKGEIILFVGDDIYPDENIINEHCISHMHDKDELAILGLVDWPKDVHINYLMHHITNVGYEQFSYGIFEPFNKYDFRHFYTCNISIKKCMLDKHEIIFNTQFTKANYEDVELAYRLEKTGLEIIYNPNAKGDHYHSYVYNRFINRQKVAGEMAVVLSDLCGNDVEWISRIDEIKKKYIELLQFNANAGERNILSQINTILSSFDNINENVLPFNIQSYLSDVYRVVFQFYYEIGLLSNVYKCIDVNSNVYFYRYFNSVAFIQSLKGLYTFLSDGYNYNPELKKIDIIQLEMSLRTLLSMMKPQTKVCFVINIDMLTALKEKYKSLENSIVFHLGSNVDSQHVDKNYWYYYPKSVDSSISVNKIKQVLLSASRHNEKIDNLIIVETLKNINEINIKNDSRHIFYSRPKLFEGKVAENKQTANCVKVLRLMPIESGFIGLGQEIEGEAFKKNELGGRNGYLNCNEEFQIENYLTSRKCFRYNIIKDKPVVFVLPTFLATGGVERLTASMIKQLKSDFSFVVINFERLNEKTGSLHSSFEPICDAIYDLCELVPEQLFNECLYDLKEMYNPSLVWICNGSIWLTENYKSIRKIFLNIPIIDQEVYDTSHGWINHYYNKDLQSFDRFIAINSKIRDRFINDFKLDSKNVDLVYHAVDSERFEGIELESEEAILLKYNLNGKKPIFATIGRLEDQKRPLLFLKMVELLQKQSVDAEFIMVGDGPLAAEVDSYIQQNSLNVKRLGFIENVAEILSVLSGVVFTSKFEGLPIASLEALCFNVPIFSTDVGDLGLVLEKYKAGVVLPVDCSVDQLALEFTKFHRDVINGSYDESYFAEKVKIDFSDKKIAEQYKESWNKGMQKYYTKN